MSTEETDVGLFLEERWWFWEENRLFWEERKWFWEERRVVLGGT